MIPVFFLRALLLAAIGQHAKGYTANRNKGLTPQLEQSETAPRSFPPSSAGYRSYLQPRTYFPSPKVSEWHSSKSSAQTSQQEQRGSSARQVDGYSRPQSASTYRPASHPSKPAQQQPQSRVYQASAVPWDSLAPQNENKFGTRIVSSGAIEFLSEPKPLHKVPPVTGEKFPGSNVPPRHPAGTFNVMPPQKVESSPSGVLQTKDVMWNLPQSRPTVTHSNAMPSQRPSSQASGVLQSKKGMWNIGSQQSPGGVASTSSSEKYKKPISRVESPQSSGVFQPRDNMWNLPQSGSTPRRQTMVHTNTMPSQRNAGSPTSVLQTKEMWNMPQTPSRTTMHSNTKPAQRKPSSQSSVLQSKEGMWSLNGPNAPNQGIEARSFRPMGLGQASAQSQQQPSLSRKPVQQTTSQMQKMAAPGRGSGITGHATVSYSNPPRGRSSQSSPKKTLTWDRSDSNQKGKGASGMASLTSLYQFDGDRPKLLPSPKKNKASS